MKITSLILFASLIFSFHITNGQDTIPNRNFETWYNPTTPAHWESTNLLLPPGNINCNQTTNSYSGEFALQLKTIDLNSIPVPGVATLGTIEMGNTSGGINFTSRPVALHGFFRHPTSGDEIMIAIEFFKRINTIAAIISFWI